MDSSTELTEGYRGAFKVTAQISQIFGIFPFSMSSKAKLVRAPWLKFYGRFVVLPYFTGTFIWSLYLNYLQTINFGPLIAVTLASLIHVFIILMQVSFAILTSDSRLSSWLICLNAIEKILMRNEATEKRESIRSKLVFSYLIISFIILVTYSLMMCWFTHKNEAFDLFNEVNNGLYTLAANVDTFLFIFLTVRIHSATVLMNEGLKNILNNTELNKSNKMGKDIILRNNFVNIKSTYKREDTRNVTQKIRDLSLSYMSISEVIRTATDCGEMGIITYILGNLLRLMTRSYKFVKIFAFGDSVPVWINLMELLFCANIILKMFLFCEPPHRIHNKMQETREILNKLERKYREEGEILNELKLFSRLTILTRPTFSPLSIVTLNRGLVAKMIGYAATYLIAIIQLEF